MNEKKVTSIVDKNNETRENLKKISNNILKNFWGSAYTNYIDYSSEIFEENPTYYTIEKILNKLSVRDISNALAKNAVGVISVPYVDAALQGTITTNPNISKNKNVDTRLGTISNTLYATSLYNGAQFNTARDTNYITPSLKSKYGNTMSTIYGLGDILNVSDKTGRVINNISGEFDLKNADKDNSTHDIFVDMYWDAIKLRSSEFNIEVRDYASFPYFENDGTSDTEGYMNDNVSGKENGDTKTFGKTSHFIYHETDNLNGENDEIDTNGEEATANQFDAYNADYEGITDAEGDSLLSKTRKLINQHKISTMINRFHTSTMDAIENYGKATTIDTAQSKKYGHSHGRNLLKLGAIKGALDGDDGKTNDMDNPYCRTWTFHHQYNQLNKLVRPFTYNDGKFYNLSDFQYKVNGYRRPVDGRDEIWQKSVLMDNGFLRINPFTEEHSKEKSDMDAKKKYMFSIENLAWKDIHSDEQGKHMIGPNGGRIMWFPPYDLNFSENINVQWNQNTFIGRGEPVYTYGNTERNGQLSFSILIDHPGIMNYTASNDYDGAQPDNDPNADILRFIAGCQLIEGKEKEEEVETPPSEEPTPEVEETNEDGQKIEFCLFFPNNYSGNYEPFEGNSSGSTNTYYQSYGTTEMGVDTPLDKLFGQKRVYELSFDGLTNLDYYKNKFKDTIDSDGYYDEFLKLLQEQYPYCQKSCAKECTDGGNGHKKANAETCNKVFESAKKKSKDKKFENMAKIYTYPVDTDLNQCNLGTGSTKNNEVPIGNYLDTKSFGLNCKNYEKLKTCGIPSDMDSFFKDVYAFSDVILALNKKQSVINEDTKSNLESWSNSEETQKISEIFENNKITKVETIGYATTQDEGDSYILAERRARYGYKLITKGFTNLLEDNFVENKNFIKLATSQKGSLTDKSNINSIEAKCKRCVKIILYYGTPETNKVDIENNTKTSDGKTEEQIETKFGDATINGENYDLIHDAKLEAMRNSLEKDDKKLYVTYTIENYQKYVNQETGTKTILYLINQIDNNILESGVQQKTITTGDTAQVLFTFDAATLNEKMKNLLDAYDIKIYDYYDYTVPVDSGKLWDAFDGNVNLYVHSDIVEGLTEEKSTIDALGDEYVPENGQTYYSTAKPNSSGKDNDDKILNEYSYFKMLHETDPFIFKRIKDKFNYFDPAFHSMTPEGFTERLNFLQQCTRQGHTNSAGDGTNAKTATNLSFGRMPVCVLRIGDFIYSRIIIRNISITYGDNGMQWDLNPEGAGVQPFYAKVNMGIALIGGSSMEGPINRLQNAQSFNYYANMPAIDGRGDRITINEDGELEYTNIYVPTSKEGKSKTVLNDNNNEQKNK